MTKPTELNCGGLRLLTGRDCLVLGSNTEKGRASLVVRGDYARALAAELIRAVRKTPSFGDEVPNEARGTLMSSKKSYYRCLVAAHVTGKTKLYIDVTRLPFICFSNTPQIITLSWTHKGQLVIAEVAQEQHAELVAFLERSYGRKRVRAVTHEELLALAEQRQELRRQQGPS